MGVATLDDNSPIDAEGRSREDVVLLEAAVSRLLHQIPETLQPFQPDQLSAVDQKALLLLTAAGLVERQITAQVRSLVHPFSAEVVLVLTGDLGFEQALDSVLAEMWNEARDQFKEWFKSDLRNSSPVRFESLSDSWKLTEDGVTARGDLDGPAIDRVGVFRFVLKLGIMAFRPSTHGSGHLKRMTRLTTSTSNPSEVSVANWDSGSIAIAQQLEALFVKLGLKAVSSSSAPEEPVSPVVPVEPSQPSPRPRSDVPDQDELEAARIACRKNPKITRDELRDQLKVSAATASNLLSTMRSEGLATSRSRKKPPSN